MSVNDLRDLLPNNSLNTINEIRNIFETELPEADNTFYNYNLNCRYGIEIEFLSSVNRFVLGNRVNNCIFKQNHPWWRNNYDAFNLNRDQQNNLPQGRRIITNNNDNFDEYSSFFIESNLNYGSKTHRGNHECQRRGIAGCKIEWDPTVTLEYDTGITLWTSTVNTNFENSEVKDNVLAGNEFEQNYSALSHFVKLYQQPYVHCCQFSLMGNPSYSDRRDIFSRLSSIFNNIELVSNVLTNIRVNYPLKKYANNDYRQGELPLGSFVIDNLFNHMLSHKSVIMTQKSGLHIHLSEFPIVDTASKINLVIGFIKLFYVFEPLIFSFFPEYRANSDFCQSLQSIFNRQEMINNDFALYNDLIDDDFDEANAYDDRSYIAGVNRKLRGQRYLSLNIQNCKQNGIGTIEIRLGHTTLDSKFMQSYIHFLQTLFCLNTALINAAAIDNRFRYHNELLRSNVIPPYCDFTPREYNIANHNLPKEKLEGRRHSPIWGFFISMGNSQADKIEKTNIIQKLYKLFFGLTNSAPTLRILAGYTNFYHSNANSWLSKNNLLEIDIHQILRQANNEVHTGPTHNPFQPIRIEEHYAIGLNQDGSFKTNMLHHCVNCAINERTNTCAYDYNRKSNLQILSRERRSPADARNQNSLFVKYCRGDYDQMGKTQSELLTTKLTRGTFAGGKRKSKKYLQKKLKRCSLQKKHTILEGSAIMEINTNNDKTDSNSDAYETYRLNAEADRINVIKNDNNYVAVITDWMGNNTEMKLLSKIINKLIHDKIIDEKTLYLLVENRYIDYYIFWCKNEIHKKKLFSELTKLEITNETIENIIQVYKNTKLPFEKNSNILSSLPIYSKIKISEE